MKHDLRERAALLIGILRRTYPDAHCELDYRTPFQLLIATILSAQCTDVRVNLTTPALFHAYPDAAALAAAPRDRVEELIRPTGFYRNKAKSIQECCRLLVERHGGKVPRTMEELRSLPGVGRKTANVVLGNAFGINEGVVVDTHVGRLSRRLGLVREMDPVKVERALARLVPRETWTQFAHWLIWHGRRRCMARKPDCAHCELEALCPRIGVRPPRAA